MSEDKIGNEFLSTLPEDMQNDSLLAKFNTVEELAKSYQNMNQILSSKIDGVSKDDTFETFDKKASNFNHITAKDDYKSDAPQEVNDLGFKYKLHPTYQLKGFLEEYNELNKKADEADKQNQVSKWKEENNALLKDVPDKDMVMARAFKELGTNRENFEKSMSDLKDHPQVVKMLLKLGAEKESDANVVLPSDTKSTQTDEKLDYIKSHVNNPNSPMYNKKHPNYMDVRQKVSKYTEELAKKEVKEGIKLGSAITK